MVRLTRLSVVVLALLLGGAATSAAQFGPGLATPSELPERFSAFATNMGDVATNIDSRQLDIRIQRWSGQKEAELIISTLKEHGPGALQTLMQDRPKVGSIATQGSLAYPVKYAHEEPWGDGGRQITLITDRYMAFWELSGGTRTRDYPFSVITLNVKKDGTGEGSMSLATKIVIQADILVFEELSTQPIRLMSLRRLK